jgi:hypothetical protein
MVDQLLAPRENSRGTPVAAARRRAALVDTSGVHCDRIRFTALV